ncbi:MAG: hypothetical protein HY093_01705, partial [Candidatus Liptonbacteria bacterium]|nr:hypothetical protein [Candidatus Liptonbacteria bacterium]
VDPINDAVKGDYYTYVVGWELDANLESKKYALAGNSDRESTDGGDRADLYERGTALNLTPGIIQVAESCVNGTPTYWGQSGADYSDYEVYSDWTIPGNGTVTVTGLRYWQGDGTLSSSEALEMAIYDGNPPYNKISGSAVVHGTGQRGWTSGDLPAPVSIQLGKTYFFGLTSDASSNPRPPVFTDYNDDGNLCPSYLPKPGNMRELVTSNGLDSSVPTPFNIFPPSRSIFGINYIP